MPDVYNVEFYPELWSSWSVFIWKTRSPNIEPWIRLGYLKLSKIDSIADLRVDFRELGFLGMQIRNSCTEPFILIAINSTKQN